MNSGIGLKSPCISPVSTVPHGGQIFVYSTSRYSSTRWSDHGVFHHSTQYHMVVRSSVHSISQHGITWWSDHRAFHQSTQYHMMVKSPCTPPVSTIPHGGRSPCIPPLSTVPHGGQVIVHPSSQGNTTWWSDHRHHSAQYHMVVRSAYIPPVKTVPHSGQIIVHSPSQHSTT